MGGEELRKAFERIDRWRSSAGEPVACPRCEAVGLRILDQSARPYAEWYALTCSRCGLAETVHRPLAAPM